MISLKSKKNIETLLPSIVERGRAGDQNALAILTEIRLNKDKNPRSAYSYKLAVDYLKKFPNKNSVNFNGESIDVYSGKLSFTVDNFPLFLRDILTNFSRDIIISSVVKNKQLIAYELN